MKFSKLTAPLQRFFGSCYQLPLGAASMLLAGFLLDAGIEWVYDEWHVWGTVMLVLGNLGGVLFLVGMLGGLLVPLWLIIMTLRLFGQGERKKILCCWGSSALAALIALGVGSALFMQSFGGGHDTFARGLEVPADRDFVLPRGMTFFRNHSTPPRVQQLIDRKVKLPPRPTHQAPGEPAAPFAAPNLDKLSREAPELLHEYLLRALYAEATDPRFASPLLEACDLYPAHENDPQTHTRRAYLAENRVFAPEGELTEADYPVAQWKLPLQNGWYIAHAVSWHDRDKNPATHPDMPATLRWMDAALAPLAQNPTREQLDTLLPPTPQQPFLCLWESGAGIYDMLIVIPDGYADGTFELRAHEVTTGSPIKFENNWRPEVKLGNVCRVLCSDGALTVFSGDWGEYYGSEWEIWFTPATGGEPRCVNRQSFLMMGWQR